MGTAFLNQVAALQSTRPNLKVDLITRSTKAIYVEAGIGENNGLRLAKWSQDLEASKQPVLSPGQILNWILSMKGYKAQPRRYILVDNTSSQGIADMYPAFLSHGINIVTPNKKAFSSSWALWDSIQATAYSPENTNGGLIYHESSVGAGLPVISTLNDLVATGDKIHRIEGVFSGTMSYLFNNFAPVDSTQGGETWSSIVSKAKDLGYTEPDPRDDLNGLDVARKLVILARLAGLRIEDTSSFPVQSLIPEPLRASDLTVGKFMARLPEFDSEMEKIKSDAEKSGKVVRFVGSVDFGTKKVQVGMGTFDKGSPVAGLKGADNIISFKTERYGDRALVIQGPGYVSHFALLLTLATSCLLPIAISHITLLCLHHHSTSNPIITTPHNHQPQPPLHFFSQSFPLLPQHPSTTLQPQTTPY